MTVKELIEKIEEKGFETEEINYGDFCCNYHIAKVNGVNIEIEYRKFVDNSTVMISKNAEHDYADFILDLIEKSKPNSVLIADKDYFLESTRALIFMEWKGYRNISSLELGAKFKGARIDFVDKDDFSLPTGTRYDSFYHTLFFYPKNSYEIENLISEFSYLENLLYKYTANEKIKKARKQAGLTQCQMSNLLGIPKKTVEAWDANEKKPSRLIEYFILEKLKNLNKKDFLNFNKCVEIYAEICKQFAEVTAGFDTLDDYKFYISDKNGWGEILDNAYGGIYVSWAFHLTAEEIEQKAAEKLYEQFINELDLADSEECDSDSFK